MIGQEPDLEAIARITITLHPFLCSTDVQHSLSIPTRSEQLHNFGISSSAKTRPSRLRPGTWGAMLPAAPPTALRCSYREASCSVDRNSPTATDMNLLQVLNAAFAKDMRCRLSGPAVLG